MAVRFLLACPDALADVQRSYVLVDDYQMHSRASQHLANLTGSRLHHRSRRSHGRGRGLRQLPLRRGHRRVHPGQRWLRTHRAERRATPAPPPPGPRAACARRWMRARRPWAMRRRKATPPRPPKVLHPRRRARRPRRPFPTAQRPLPRSRPWKPPTPPPRWTPWPMPCRPRWRREPTPPRFTCSPSIPAWERRVARALEARGIAAATPVRGRVAAGDYRDLDRCAAGTPADGPRTGRQRA